MGSDHHVITIKVSMGMFTEEIKGKPKIDQNAFLGKLEQLRVDDIHSISDFILVIEDAKLKATTRSQTLKNPKFTPRAYWNEDIKRLQKEKKLLS